VFITSKLSVRSWTFYIILPGWLGTMNYGVITANKRDKWLYEQAKGWGTSNVQRPTSNVERPTLNTEFTGQADSMTLIF
jgi:hypothetical protein